MTKAGWIYIVITLFIGFAAVNTGNNLLFLILSAFLGFMAVSGFIGRKNVQNLQLELSFPDEVYANVDFPLKIALINRKRFLPAFLIKVDISGREILFPLVENREEKVIDFKIKDRGVFNIQTVTFCSIFPFGFFVRCFSYNVDIQKVVFPQPKRCELFQSLGMKSKKKGERDTTRVGYEGELISIRDYTGSSPVKYIHWKATAKTDTLKEKELSQTSSIPVYMKFEEVQIQDLEEKLSCITYLLIRSVNMDIDLFVEYRGNIFYGKSKHQRNTLLDIMARM
ncbi:MAG: DUF58 domain-containing protein [Hydrogenothermaceae bacterium]|nr:DUF58 domain-containing protein [Hydrogenothermaceae bacterium]